MPDASPASSRPVVVAFAYSGFGHAGLEALARLGADLRLVFSHADKPGENIWWPSSSAWCAQRGVPCLLDADLKDPAVVGRVAAIAPDFLFSFYYRSMIPGRVLRLATRGGYNLHGSLLPRYRGRAPINWAVLNGERRIGLTLHRMTTRADAGDIVAQQGVEVGPDEDAKSVVDRLLADAPALLDRAIGALFAGTATHTPQDESQATVFGGRRPEDGRIDWHRPARAIHDLVRAVARPFPGASAVLAGRPLAIWRTRVAAERGRGGAPGSVRSDGLVACGDGLIDILEATDAAGVPIAITPGSAFDAAPHAASGRTGSP